jgi:hypothetical protein
VICRERKGDDDEEGEKPGKEVAVAGVNLKTEMAEGESAAVIGPTRLPASRVASSYGCNCCEPGSLVEPSTTPSSSVSVSRVKREPEGVNLFVNVAV